MAKYSFCLSAQSVRDLQRELKEYKKTLNDKVAELMNNLAEKGVETVRANIVYYGAYFDGDLLNSVKSKVRKSDKNHITVVIQANSKHAVYVEFGTGHIGAEHPYKGNVPVVYSQGKFIRYNAETDKYYWYYYKYGTWHYTEGLPSRPFMLDSATMLRTTIIQEEIKRVFKDVK